MKTTESVIAGRKCFVCHQGTDGPYVYWGTEPNRNDIETVAQEVSRLVDGLDFHLVAFEAKDWNADFSPWPAPPVYGKEAFSSQASTLLFWLTDACIPQVEDFATVRWRFIAGYSLAGLFSLWALCNSEVFSGVASCSGSLWFPHWLDFLQSASNKLCGCPVYLSLGDTEENTKHPVMSTVGEATRQSYALISSKTNAILEWNKGGHFSHPSLRTAQGIAWLIQQTFVP